MDIRRFISWVLSVALLMTLSACKTGDSTDASGKDALRVCFDSNDIATTEAAMYDFLSSFKRTTGIENVEIECLPRAGVERETAIKRMRTEIMSGSGPDVFLVRCSSADNALFPYPEKVMEAGLFLPLDEYMENSTEFTEWDKQQQVVLAAGRNEEGQQIIPLTYTCPIQIHLKSELDVDKPDRLLTFDEALSDPEWSSVYMEFFDCRDVFSVGSGELKKAYCQAYLQYILGKSADFVSEELSFTEEELLATIEQILALSEDSPLEETEYDETLLSASVSKYNVPITILPLYSKDGGVTVSVDSIAAINRNTKKPDEAYKFLDFFMREQTQLNSDVYEGFYLFEGIPPYDDAFSENAPYNRQFYLQEEAFTELTEFKEQISAVNFESELSKDLCDLMWECWCADEVGLPLEKIVHEAYIQMQRKVRE